MSPGQSISAARGRASASWVAIKARRPGVEHAARAYQHYKANRGDHLAAAITYFSFLALFPLILLGVSVAGFVFAHSPDLQQRLFDSISENLPGTFGSTVRDTIDGAVRNRTSVGIVGLAGFAVAGLGWISNLRTAIETVWGVAPKSRNFLVAKGADAVVLVGLGIGAVVSVGLTAGGTAASGQVLKWLNLDGVTGMGTLAAVVGVLLAILGSTLLFGWLIIRLPAMHVSRRTTVRTALLAAAGFEILKVVGAYYIARVTKSPAAAAIGPVVGILIWIDLVSRYLLYCVAWAATAEPVPVQAPLVAGPSIELAPPARRGGFTPVGVAAGLISAGAALGAVSVTALRRWYRAPPPPRQPRR
ncbi:MAG: rane protein [Frankiales bacterium]|nr:rane protein [Frankiales bacterium]